MGLRESWPTFWIDLFSNLPFVLLNCFFKFQGHSGPTLRKHSAFSNALSLDPPNFMELMRADWRARAAFATWSIEVALSMGVTVMHMVVRHHPKFYATPCNRLAIVMHIVGGVTAILGSYIGFILQNKCLLYVAVFSGIFLHFPSAMWQARNLHGSREIMQPGYMFINIVLLVKEIDVLTEGAASFTVLEMGLALGIFSLVRFYYWLLTETGTAPQSIYDRACIFAVVTNLPFVLGMFAGVPLFLGTIAIWNVLMGIFFPRMREMMRIIHNYNSVLPPSLHPKKKFHDELRSCLLMYPNRHEAVARSVFNCLAEGKDYVNLEEVAAMTEHWGMNDSAAVAKEIFNKADTNHDNRLEFEEFKEQMWFVWEHVEDVGELECTDTDVITTVEDVLHEAQADQSK